MFLSSSWCEIVSFEANVLFFNDQPSYIDYYDITAQTNYGFSWSLLCNIVRDIILTAVIAMEYRPLYVLQIHVAFLVNSS